MASTPPSDPRASDSQSVLPSVARPSTGLPIWALAIGAVLLGVILFLVLDAHRRSLSAPAVRVIGSDAVAVPAPPPLYIPPEPTPAAPIQPLLPAAMPTPQAIAPLRPQAPQQQIMPYIPPPMPMPAQQMAQVPQRPARIATEPALVIDATSQQAGGASGSTSANSAGAGDSGDKVAGPRAGAGVMANRATTVPQGTLIPAVLETALDSTSAGLARALVSHDVRSFDGTRILIPRGSRLIGEYGAKTESGQKRMLVNWIRLIRPDGATIAIGSPAGDPMGRGGIRAKVDSHFFARFSGAFLQSALDIGVNLASRSSNSPVVVALPGSLQGTLQPATTPQQIQPTLTVKAATSISIFVARDLDFTGVEQR